MNTDRRLAILGGATLAVAACTPGASTSSNVQTVFNGIQFVLPLVDVMAAGIAIAVPGAAPIVAVVAPYLNNAAAVFQGLSATMSEAEAKPLVQKIETYVAGAIDAVGNAMKSSPKLAEFQPKLEQAKQVLALLTAFVNGVKAMPTARAAMPRLLHR
jgi:hypothetical protein